jgi:uncharacterized membrane-anchored protein YjiN (DUF445 family)
MTDKEGTGTSSSPSPSPSSVHAAPARSTSTSKQQEARSVPSDPSVHEAAARSTSKQQEARSAASEPISLRPGEDAERERALRRMKGWATGLLVLATIIFIVARLFESRYPWLGIVIATAEASMIGALADWFAVTALFKHPMGIPIPHTAIIPARKDRVGITLGMFVQRNFLNRDVIAQRLATLRPAERLSTWLMEPESVRLVSRQIARAASAGANVLRDEDVDQLIGNAVMTRIRETPVAPLIGKFLALLTADNRHQALLDQVIRLTARGLTENQDLIRDRVDKETPWWVPGTVDDKITKRIVEALEATLKDVNENPEHPLRLRFDTAIDEFIVKLQASPEVILKAEQIKEEVLSADAVKKLSGAIWRDTKATLGRYADSPDEVNTEAIERGLRGLGQAIQSDPALMAKIDQWIIDATISVIERYQNEVGELIASTVKRWGPVATSRRIELAIGRDLQVVRINGTLVGGLAGMLLYLLGGLF